MRVSQEEKDARIQFLEERQEELLALVSQQDPAHRKCKTFCPKGCTKCIQHGGYHACLFVEFEGSERQRCVLRIRLKTVQNKELELVQELMQGEILAMRVIAEKTSIPVPTVHYADLSNRNLVGSPYMILSYIEGRPSREVLGRPSLSSKVLRELVNVWQQLSQLTFPACGSLGLGKGCRKSLLDCDVDDICVRSRPLTTEIIDQELAGYNPSAFISKNQTYTTMSDLVDGLKMISDNQLAKSGDLAMDQRTTCMDLYARGLFHDFFKRFQRGKPDVFCLVPGDIRMHASNILFDDDANLVGLIDFEKSWVMPLQFLCAPVWLLGYDFTIMMDYSDVFNSAAPIFVDFDSAQTKDSVTRTEDDAALARNYALETAMVIALLEPDYIYTVFWRMMKDCRQLWRPHHEVYQDFFNEDLGPAIMRTVRNPDAQLYMELMAKRQAEFWHKEDPSRQRSFVDEELDRFLIQCDGCPACKPSK